MRNKTKVCVEEYLVNLISHGFGDSEKHLIHINITRTKDSLYIEMMDDGEAFNPLEVAAPDIEMAAEEREVGGLGIHIIRNYMDELSYESGDQINRFCMIKFID